MNVHAPSTLPAGGHRYVTRVYYEDTDAGGVVYHATYLRMAERARTEALRDAGVSHAELSALHGMFFVVRRIKLDYAAPARLDDSLLVVTRPLSLRSASVDLRQEFFRAGPSSRAEWVATRPLVVAEVGLACVRRAETDSAAGMGSATEPGAFRPARIPDRWRAALAPSAAEKD